jgi:hypothetical protein
MRYLITFFCLLLTISCEKDKENPVVDTLYLPNSNGGEQQEIEAAVKLYERYMNSPKDKEYYEVVCKGDFILNYFPSKQWITVCTDVGSGWSYQFKEVDISKLGELSQANLPFEKYKEFLSPNNPMQSNLIKSNGEPH